MDKFKFKLTINDSYYVNIANVINLLRVKFEFNDYKHNE